MTRRELNKFKPSGSEVTPPQLHRASLLIGDGGIEKLKQSRVAVIGLGGVGSWCAEFLARTGIGELHIFDFDVVDITNVNRQLQAFPDFSGIEKSKILAERLSKIAKFQKIISHHTFIDDKSFDDLNISFDFVVEAIDHITAKASLLSYLYRKGTPVVTSLGAASRLDPTLIRSEDLANTTVCPLGKDLRKILRRKYGFPLNGEMGIRAVYSMEKPYNTGGNKINGSLVQVTSAFGSALASVVINNLALPYQ